MSTPDTVIAQLTNVRDKARAKLEQSDLDLTGAVDALIEGYGTSTCEHTDTVSVVIKTAYEPNKHYICRMCRQCYATIEKVELECIDNDGDGLCDLCGCCVDCKEFRRKIVPVDGQRHCETYVCNICNKPNFTVIDDCVDDGTGKCVDCGQAISR